MNTDKIYDFEINKYGYYDNAVLQEFVINNFAAGHLNYAELAFIYAASKDYYRIGKDESIIGIGKQFKVLYPSKMIDYLVSKNYIRLGTYKESAKRLSNKELKRIISTIIEQPGRTNAEFYEIIDGLSEEECEELFNYRFYFATEEGINELQKTDFDEKNYSFGLNLYQSKSPSSLEMVAMDDDCYISVENGMLLYVNKGCRCQTNYCTFPVPVKIALYYNDKKFILTGVDSVYYQCNFVTVHLLNNGGWQTQIVDLEHAVSIVEDTEFAQQLRDDYGGYEFRKKEEFNNGRWEYNKYYVSIYDTIAELILDKILVQEKKLLKCERILDFDANDNIRCIQFLSHDRKLKNLLGVWESHNKIGLIKIYNHSLFDYKRGYYLKYLQDHSKGHIIGELMTLNEHDKQCIKLVKDAEKRYDKGLFEDVFWFYYFAEYEIKCCKDNGYLEGIAYEKELLLHAREVNLIPSRWRHEFLLYCLVKEFYDDVIFQYRAPFLNLQSYDIFIPSLNVAIEYQGAQHYEAVDFFGGEDAFKQNKIRDEKKRQLSKQNSVTLIEYPYTVDVSRENLTNILKEYGIITRSSYPKAKYMQDNNLLIHLNQEISKPHAKKLHENSVIRQYGLDGLFIHEYNSIHDASKGTGISEGSISLNLCNIHKSAGGYMWIRAEHDSDILESIEPLKLLNNAKHGKRSITGWSSTRGICMR